MTIPAIPSIPSMLAALSLPCLMASLMAADPFLDVTAKVADRIVGNALIIKKAGDGFPDPAEGMDKKFRIEYSIDGEAGTKTWGEDEKISLTAKPGRKLVILKAVYGDLPDKETLNASGLEMIADVTAETVAMLKDGKLEVLEAGEGIPDPAEGVDKKFRVEYTIEGEAGTRTCDEGNALRLAAKPGKKLALVKVTFGDLPEKEDRNASGLLMIADVTADVNDMVKGNAVQVEGPGDLFPDCAVGVDKRCRIEYAIDGKVGTRTCNEDGMIRLAAQAGKKLTIVKATYGDLPDMEDQDAPGLQ